MPRDTADVIVAIDQKALLRRRAGGAPFGVIEAPGSRRRRGPVEMFAGKRQAQVGELYRHSAICKDRPGTPAGAPPTSATKQWTRL